MNSSNKTISVASVFVVLVLAIYQIQARNNQADEISALKHSHEEALKLSRDTIASLQATIATLNRQLTAEAGRANAAGTQASIGISGNSTAAMAGLQANTNVPTNIQQQIRGLMGSPEVQKTMSKMLVNNTYGDFIRGLHLSASEKESLSQIFANSMQQKTDLQFKLASGLMTQAEYNAAVKDIDSKLRNSLSGYLYKEEMSAFDQYEATKDTRAAARALQGRESDLERNAPELTPASRKYVAKMFADETARLRAQTPGINVDPQGPAALVNTTVQPLETALQKMKSEAVLDKIQLNAVEDYVAQQKDMIESITQITGQMQRR